VNGKVVVNRCMSLDGFIAGPGHAMDWGGGRALADFVAPDDFAEIAAATGAMLVGRRTWEVGDRMEAEEPGSVDYPFSGPMFLLTHRPLERRDPEVTILTGDIGEAVATALDAAGGKQPRSPRRRRGRPVPAAGARRRDPGLRTAGTARRRHPLLVPRPRQDGTGSDQQHAVARRHDPPHPRPKQSGLTVE
jgi:hypothetical protein